MFKQLFTPKDHFSPHEWIFKYKVISLLFISFIVGNLLFIFSIYRFSQGYIFVGAGELFAGSFLLFSFFKLRHKKSYYKIFSMLFSLLLFTMLVLLFYLIPEPATRFHWAPTALVAIFFLMDYKGGILFLGSYLFFIVFIMFTSDPYSTVEYVTWVASLSILSLIMYFYEKLKDSEKTFLLDHASELKSEVAKKTIKLQHLNNKLEERVQEELTQRLKQRKILLHQSRLAGMGEMLDSIAHQWRQPLMNINAILMNMELDLNKKESSKVNLDTKMNEITALTSHMSQTIEDFRSIFSDDKEKSLFYLHTAAEYALNLLKSSLREVNITYNPQKNILFYGFKNEMIQVFIILLNNASEVLTAKNIKTKWIKISFKEEQKQITITLEDNAGGIDENHLQIIFDPYFTTKEATGGTGLGLYIAKMIIEKNMSGKLIVKNTKEGAKFTIYTPKNSIGEPLQKIAK